MTQSADAYTQMFWWKKVVAERVITEDGVYAKGEVPTDYAKGELTVDVIQRVIYTTEGGDITELNMDHRDTVMSKTKVKGVGATWDWGIAGCAAITLATPAGSTVVEKWKVYTNPALSADMAARALQMYQQMLKDKGLLAST